MASLKTTEDQETSCIQTAGMSGSSRAESYKEVSTTFQAVDGVKLIDLLSITEGSRVLDLGCGTGNLTALLAERVGSNGCVIGVDPDGERIKIAQEENAKDNISFIEACGETFPEDQYDVVFSNHVLHWIKDKEPVFKRVYDNLCPGGKFAFIIGQSVPPMYEEVLDTLEPSRAREARKKLFYVPIDTVEDLAVTYGFTVTFRELGTHHHKFENVERAIEFFYASATGEFDPSQANKEALKKFREKYGQGPGPVEFAADIACFILTKA